MPDTPVISLSCPRRLRVGGDIIAGVLNLNLGLAEKKDVVSVTLSLRGEINAQVTVQSNSGNNRTTTTHRDNVRLFTQEQIIWTPGAPLPPHASGIASFPFTFTLPTTSLPPSFHGGNASTGGSVQYYLHAVGARESWYQRNIRVDEVFPFVPIDMSPAPTLPLPNWPGQWETFNASEKMRRGIISHHGLVEVEFHMPSLPTIPLFRPIPVRLRIICTSKPLPASAAGDPAKFDFPRIPKAADVDLTLRQVCHIQVRGSYNRERVDNLGLQAGFGLPDETSMRATWGNQIQVSTAPPRWTVEERDKSKGRWTEEVTFSSMLIFRCPPPFSSPILTSTLYLDLDIDFPGIGNKVKTNVGPLPLTSGIGPPQQLYSGGPPHGSAMPQPILREMDLPPSYYEVLHMDEGTKGPGN